MAKFVMPEDPGIQLAVFQAMLAKVDAAIEKVPESQAKIEASMSQHQEAGDVQKLRDAYFDKCELRRQELCLIDQKRRLEEKINGLRLALQQ